MAEDLLPEEQDTVPTEEEAKKLQLPKDLSNIQKLYYLGKSEDAEALLIEKLKYHFDIDVLDLRDRVATFVKEQADELAAQVSYIVPNGDWSKCLSEDEAKQNYLIEEGGKPENWRIKSLGSTHLPKVWAVSFVMDSSESEDDGIVGYAYVSETGKVKHIFAQGE